MRRDPTETILQTIVQNRRSLCQLSFNIKNIFMNAYDPICQIENCFVCKVCLLCILFVECYVIYLSN